MDEFINLLISHGYLGMLVSAFLAGSILPFSSEAVMLGLIAVKLDPWMLIIYGTIGNVAGGMLNYWVGTMGKIDRIERYLHVKKEKIEKTHRFMEGHGAWMGFFAFLPIIGSAITIVLGLTRANLPISIGSITLGKFLRYVLLAYGAGLMF